MKRERGGGGETDRGEEREGVTKKREREAKPVVQLGGSIRFFNVSVKKKTSIGASSLM